MGGRVRFWHKLRGACFDLCRMASMRRPDKAYPCLEREVACSFIVMHIHIDISPPSQQILPCLDIVTNCELDIYAHIFRLLSVRPPFRGFLSRRTTSIHCILVPFILISISSSPPVLLYPYLSHSMSHVETPKVWP